MRRPIVGNMPRLDLITVERRGRNFSLPYFFRAGTGQGTVLFVHGLGGSKENFYVALQSPALSTYTLLMFDFPGTGLAPYSPEDSLDVSGLADIAHEVARKLIDGPYWLAGASMGGLISLLMIRKHGLDRIRGLINIEGNLCPEDCMFSRRVIPYSLEAFDPMFEQMIRELSGSRFAGEQIIAQNMALNVDARAYHAYSFETVLESDSGKLLDEFIELDVPKLFLYGEQNRSLSYLPALRASSVEVKEVPSSAHFLFYDNPVATFQEIGHFISTRKKPGDITIKRPHH
jgi:pimeloyl-ACP methyl ester carboxylesterase